jgi:hypothetical protein
LDWVIIAEVVPVFLLCLALEICLFLKEPFFLGLLSVTVVVPSWVLYLDTRCSLGLLWWPKQHWQHRLSRSVLTFVFVFPNLLDLGISSQNLT